MPSHHIVFSHGKESGPWGTKIKTLAETATRFGYHVHSIDYQGIDKVDLRVKKLTDSLPQNCENLILVGSSMGAYVSIEASRSANIQGLFLLAPAVYLSGYPNQAPSPQAKHISVVHGWQDDIVPAENAIRFSRTHHTSCHLLNDGHRLMDCLPKVNEVFALFLKECAQTM